MNKKQYNNVIEHTLKSEQSARTDDSLATARAIFDNMGVALPQGDIKTVYEIIKKDNYMGWKSCTMKEAQDAADNGIAAIGIGEDRIVVLSAKDEEQPVVQTASVMTLDENTSAFSVDGMRYYSYSYGGTGGSTIGTGWNGYCGGSNYKDVTKHNMILQNDGYYVCSKCGYRIMSPSLQDHLVLSTDDHLRVISLIHYYSQMILLADGYPLKAAYYNSFADSAKTAIDTIRSKNEYNRLYDYQGSNGKYYCAKTNDTTASFVALSKINWLTIGSYNGVYESIAQLVLGYYCPEVALLVDVTKLLTEEVDAFGFAAFVATVFGLDEYAQVLSNFSTLLGMATSEVQIGDRVVNISFNAYSHAVYVFDKDNRIKEVRIFNEF